MNEHYSIDEYLPVWPLYAMLGAGLALFSTPALARWLYARAMVAIDDAIVDLGGDD